MTLIVFRGLRTNGLLERRCFNRSSSHIFSPKNRLGKNEIESLPTSELLQKIGFIKQTRSGLLDWLPLGLRSLRKIEDVVHSGMRDVGAEEVSLSSLSPRELWLKTNRWSNSELFKLKDSQGSEYCLTPTCEEDITNLMKNYITSYKDMPITVYQITRKYRDELRPRGGSLRSREFLMKDAYSFSSSKEDALETFDTMNLAYEKILKKIKVPFTSAWAESGEIGGDMSKEYHYKHKTGEDTLLTCSECQETSNIERCESYPIESSDFVKNVKVKYYLSKDHVTLLAFYYPEGRTLNGHLVKTLVEDDIDMSFNDKHSDEEVIKIFKENNPELMFARVIRVMDCRLDHTSNFPDLPLKLYSKQNFAQIDDVSIVNATEEEECGSCRKGVLVASQSIEIAHTFHLGTKYTEQLNVKFTDNNNNSNNFVEMGCYGIGISRLIGAIAEISRDSKGFRWPASISPFKVSICSPPDTKGQTDNEIRVTTTKSQVENVPIFKNQVFTSFNEKMSLGQKVQLVELIGIPLNVIIGPKNWPNVEIEVRGKRWDGSESWKENYNQHKEEFNWKCTPATEANSEKHLINIKHLNDVLEYLIKDL